MKTKETQKAPMGRKRIGECLIEAGLIDQETLAKALELQKSQKKKIGQVLIEMGVADEVTIAKALAQQLKIPFIRLEKKKIPEEVVKLVPAELAENYLLIPIQVQDKKLVVAMSNPLEFYALDDLRFVTHMNIKTAVAPERDILDALERHYPKPGIEKGFDAGPDETKAVELIRPVETDEKDLLRLMNIAELPPVVRLANSILADAIKLKASDVHVEPQQASVIIRYRIDGIMREIMQTDKHVHAALVSRVKILSNMDISIRRKPQDGRSQIRYGDEVYDLRVSSIPTSYGEKLTIRILNPKTAAMGFEQLGLSGQELEILTSAIRAPQGIILVTGPTGSGKSSTLYACLNKINKPSVNIVTVEDPIEFDIKGINQVQINPAAGVTFASGLRSILRQDPDVVMVGEIRDGETAAIALQAAQTGHLVLSTLHTNDAPAAVTRLMDLGVESFLISDALLMVAGQRLVRGICPHCKISDPLSFQFVKQLPIDLRNTKEATFWKGAGCEKCQYTGYSGRLGIYEVLKITPAVKGIIAAGVSALKIKTAALKEGFRPMFLDGIHKALNGLTTLEEVFRVAPPEVETVDQEYISTPGPKEGKLPEEELPVETSFSIKSVKPKKILVADDNQIIIKLLVNILESENYHVVSTDNGLDALKMAHQEKPDLIITDYLMPQLNGMELIKKIKSQLSTRVIPIIMLTAKDEVDAEVAVIDAGADDYLTKPLNAKRILARVARLLG
ncbi:MAG: type II/IV secretion system protein [Thermodesulfobacteriota bacterium]